MIKTWRSYIFHPLFIGFIVSAISIFFIVKHIPHYKTKITETYTVNNNGQITYADLNNDGNAEKIHYYHYHKVFEPMLYVYDTDNNIQSLWNFFESPIKNCPVYIGDFNKDSIQEIYLFTQKTDSVFLYVLNTEKEKDPFVKKQVVSVLSQKTKDVEINTIGLFDLNNDGTKEFLFSLDVGYPGSPVKIYAYNFRQNKLMASANLNADLEDHVLINDIDQDQNLELLISNRSVAIDGNGSQAQFIVLDHRLDYKFEPVKFNGLPSRITTSVVKQNDTLLLACLHSGLYHSEVFNNLQLFDRKGNKRGEKSLHYKDNLRLIQSDDPAYLFILSKQKLIKLNNRFKRIKTISIGRNDDLHYVGRFNLGLGNSSEYIFRDKYDLYIYFDDFKKKINLKNIAKGELNLSAVNMQNQHVLLSLQSGNKWYLIDVVKNEAYAQLILFQVLIFIIILFVIYFISNFISSKRSLKTKQNIREEKATVLNIPDLKEELEQPSIADYIESIATDQKENHFKEDIYELLKSCNKLIDCSFYPENKMFRLNDELKQQITRFIKDAVNHISLTNRQEKVSIQFFNHDNHLNIAIESEKGSLETAFIEKELSLNVLRDKHLWQIDFVDVSEQRNLLNIHIPLKSNSREGAVRVILAEDHDVSLFGLMSMFKMYDDVEVVGTAKNGMEVLKMLESKKAEVVITDISMPGMDGIELSGQLKKDYPQIKVIVFTMYMENWFVEQLLNNDVKGFVSKSSKINELVYAVRDVSAGLNYYCPQFKAKFGVQSDHSENKEHKLDSLTNFEIQIVKLFAEDLKKNEIATKLNLSKQLMDSMLANILLKINAANENEITRIAKRQKFISE